MEKVIDAIRSELTACEDADYERQLIQTLDYLVFNFDSELVHERVFSIITDTVFTKKRIQPVSSRLVKEVLVKLIE